MILIRLFYDKGHKCGKEQWCKLGFAHLHVDQRQPAGVSGEDDAHLLFNGPDMRIAVEERRSYGGRSSEFSHLVVYNLIIVEHHAYGMYARRPGFT